MQSLYETFLSLYDLHQLNKSTFCTERLRVPCLVPLHLLHDISAPVTSCMRRSISIAVVAFQSSTEMLRLHPASSICILKTRYLSAPYQLCAASRRAWRSLPRCVPSPALWWTSRSGPWCCVCAPPCPSAARPRISLGFHWNSQKHSFD